MDIFILHTFNLKLVETKAIHHPSLLLGFLNSFWVTERIQRIESYPSKVLSKRLDSYVILQRKTKTESTEYQ